MLVFAIPIGSIGRKRSPFAHKIYTKNSSKSDLKLVNYFLNSNWTIDDHDLDAFAVRKNIKFLYYLFVESKFEKLGIFIDFWLRPNSICNQIEIWKCGEETQPTRQWLSFPFFLFHQIYYILIWNLSWKTALWTHSQQISLFFQWKLQTKIK